MTKQTDNGVGSSENGAAMSAADLEQVVGGVDRPVFRNALDNSSASQAKSLICDDCQAPTGGFRAKGP